MKYPFRFPDIGEGITEGHVQEIVVQPGESVKEGQILVVVETDKVTADIPSPVDGRVIEYTAQAGEVIEVGAVLVYIETEAVEESQSVVGQIASSHQMVLPASDEGQRESGKGYVRKETVKTGNRRAQASPLARKLAEQMNVNLDQIRGSGPLGRVLKNDILDFINNNRSIDQETVQLNQLRKTLVANMEKSHLIPSSFLNEYVIIDELLKIREDFHKNMEERISLQVFFMKALALALKDFPQINAVYNEEDQSYTTFKNVNLGFAVHTEAGLVVPVIREVEQKTLIEINEEMKRLVKEVLTSRFDISLLKGGTFTITNYGAFGGLTGGPMLLPPQVGIMGFGRIHQGTCVKDGQVVPAWQLPLCFTFDHRVVDGAPAGTFLTNLSQLLSNPINWILKMK